MRTGTIFPGTPIWQHFTVMSVPHSLLKVTMSCTYLRSFTPEITAGYLPLHTESFFCLLVIAALRAAVTLFAQLAV